MSPSVNWLIIFFVALLQHLCYIPFEVCHIIELIWHCNTLNLQSFPIKLKVNSESMLTVMIDKSFKPLYVNNRSKASDYQGKLFKPIVDECLLHINKLAVIYSIVEPYKCTGFTSPPSLFSKGRQPRHLYYSGHHFPLRGSSPAALTPVAFPQQNKKRHESFIRVWKVDDEYSPGSLFHNVVSIDWE